MSVTFHRWTLGFKQFSFDHITQALRSCLAYTPSAVLRFIDMLLSPRPFESRLVIRLGVIYPELRLPLVTIHSVRTTAHSFQAHGSLASHFEIGIKASIM